MLKKILYILLLLIVFKQAFSQEYLDEKTMKLTEVSTDNTYGYTINNPIKVGAANNATGKYLKALKGPSGDNLILMDIIFNVKYKQGINAYTVQFTGKSKPFKLYLSLNEYESPKCPMGLTFKTEEDVPKVVKYPEDSIIKVTTCDTEVGYGVTDNMLKVNIPIDFKMPDVNPDFAGGMDALKQYFTEHPLTDARAETYFFKVHIAFTINCRGEAGNFKLIDKIYRDKDRGDIETLSNQVLGVVNRMPQNWKPAYKNNQAVDCIQVLHFTVEDGELNKFYYR